MVTIHMARVVVVALMERDIPLSCAMVKGAVRGCAVLGALGFDTLFFSQKDHIPAKVFQ